MTNYHSHPLSDFVNELEDTAEKSDKREQQDACKVLAAVARGEPVPPDVAQRIVNRVKEEK